MKKLNVNLNLRINEELTNEEIANKVKSLLESKLTFENGKTVELSGIEVSENDDDLDNINISLLGRDLTVERADTAMGYESRMWSKTTC